MTRMVASLSALILSIVLLVSGNAFLMTLLGIRLGIEQVAPDIIGWVLVCYSIGFVLGTLYVHRIIGRWVTSVPSPCSRPSRQWRR